MLTTEAPPVLEQAEPSSTEAHQGRYDDPLRDPMALDPLSPFPPSGNPFGRNRWEPSHA
jgi:hypothetical protein